MTLLDALSGKTGKLATVADLYQAQGRAGSGRRSGAGASLCSPSRSAPITGIIQARIYAVTPGPVREDKYAAASIRAAGPRSLLRRSGEPAARGCAAEPDLVILFDDSVKGADIRKLVDFGESLGIPVKYVCLLDYSNSRGAVDMGLMPELLPGYRPPDRRACTSMKWWTPDLDVLWVVGANPLEGARRRRAPASWWSRTCS